MTYTEALERKSEMLKKNVENWILKENRSGLSQQEAFIYRHMIKELHQNKQELHTAREEEWHHETSEPVNSEMGKVSIAKAHSMS